MSPFRDLFKKALAAASIESLNEFSRDTETNYAVCWKCLNSEFGSPPIEKMDLWTSRLGLKGRRAAAFISSAKKQRIFANLRDDATRQLFVDLRSEFDLRTLAAARLLSRIVGKCEKHLSEDLKEAVAAFQREAEESIE